MSLYYQIIKAIPTAKQRTLKLLKIKNVLLYQQLMDSTSFMAEDTILSDRLLFVKNKITTLPACKMCGTIHQHINRFVTPKKISEYCSVQCYHQDKEALKNRAAKVNQKDKVNKMISTNLQRFGVMFNNQREQIREQQRNIPTKQRQLAAKKGKQTKIQKYGYEHFKPDMPFVKVSKGEKELLEYLNSFGFSFRSRRFQKNGFEIDMYDENTGLGIEFSGLRFHNDGPPNYCDKNYHFRKYKECQQLGINLITIWDNEWKHKRSQIQDFLKARLGVFEKRIYAKKCVVKQIEPDKTFFEENHIQGSPHRIKLMVGLYYENELVGAMSFATHHRNNNDFVLNRLCFKQGYQIVGGVAKLFRESLKHIDVEKIVTWSDNRWSTGNIYKQLGFILENEQGPDYFYVKYGYQIKSKQSMQKKKINCPSELTEHQYCKQLGYHRVWDCGKKRWAFNTKNRAPKRPINS